MKKENIRGSGNEFVSLAMTSDQPFCWLSLWTQSQDFTGLGEPSPLLVLFTTITRTSKIASYLTLASIMAMLYGLSSLLDC